jgi:hypothetical protein
MRCRYKNGPACHGPSLGPPVSRLALIIWLLAQQGSAIEVRGIRVAGKYPGRSPVTTDHHASGASPGDIDRSRSERHYSRICISLAPALRLRRFTLRGIGTAIRQWIQVAEELGFGLDPNHTPVTHGGHSGLAKYQKTVRRSTIPMRRANCHKKEVPTLHP